MGSQPGSPWRPQRRGAGGKGVQAELSPTLGHAIQPSLKTSEERAPASLGSCAATNAPADPPQRGRGSQQRCWALWPRSKADGRQSWPGSGTGSSCRRPGGSHANPPIAPFAPHRLGMNPVGSSERAPAVCCSSQPPASTRERLRAPQRCQGTHLETRTPRSTRSPLPVRLCTAELQAAVCRDAGPRAPNPPLSVPELPQGTHPQNSAAPELRYSPSHTPGPALLPPAATSYPPELSTGEAAARELWLSPTYTPVVSQISESWGCPGSAPTLRRAQRCTVRSAHLLPRAKPVHPSAPVTRRRAALEDKPGRGERPPPRSPPASSRSRPPS